MAKLQMEVEKKILEDGTEVVIASVTGIIDGYTFRDFESRLEKLGSSPYLILVLGGVTYINSTGMGLIVKMADKMKEQGGNIKLVHVPEKVRTIFSMLGINNYFEIFESPQEAINSLLNIPPQSEATAALLSSDFVSEVERVPPANSSLLVDEESTGGIEIAEEDDSGFKKDPKKNTTGTSATGCQEAVEKKKAPRPTQKEIPGDRSDWKEEKTLSVDKTDLPEPTMPTVRRTSNRPSSKPIGQLGKATSPASSYKGTPSSGSTKPTGQTGKMPLPLSESEPRPTTPIAMPTEKDAREGEKKGKPEPVSAIEEGKRNVAVRYFQRMNPFRSFPLSAVFSREEIARSLPREASQAEGSKKLAFRPGNPIVQIVPVMPGCLVSPPQKQLDVTPDTVETHFEVMPLAEGDFRRACVEIYYENRLVESISTPVRVSRQTWAKVSLCLGLISPFVSVAVDALAVDARPGYARIGSCLSNWAAGCGGVFALGAILAGAFFLFAAALYAWKRPREAKPIDAAFSWGAKSRA